MPLQYVLWRLSEGQEEPLIVGITAHCPRLCGVVNPVQVTRRLVPQDPKPERLVCPLSHRGLRIEGARRVSEGNRE